MTYNPLAHPASAATPDLSDIPPEVLAALKKYRSIGGAVKADDAQAVDLLLRHRAATGQDQGEDNKQDLHVLLLKAAPSLSPAVADVLMDHGARIGLVANHQDAVQTAVAAQNDALVRHFIDTGVVEPDHAESDGTTLLMAALQAEHYDLADYLLSKGAQVDRQRLPLVGGGDTALHLAARQASFQSVIWLIENGADPGLENTDGRRACEEIPSLDKESEKEWDLDAMFDALEDYKEARDSGAGFQIPDRLREMAHLEATPMTAMEAAMIEMAKAQGGDAAEDEVGLLPKKKKVGF